MSFSLKEIHLCIFNRPAMDLFLRIPKFPKEIWTICIDQVAFAVHLKSTKIADWECTVVDFSQPPDTQMSVWKSGKLSWTTFLNYIIAILLNLTKREIFFYTHATRLLRVTQSSTQKEALQIFAQTWQSIASLRTWRSVLETPTYEPEQKQIEHLSLHNRQLRNLNR